MEIWGEPIYHPRILVHITPSVGILENNTTDVQNSVGLGPQWGHEAAV